MILPGFIVHALVRIRYGGLTKITCGESGGVSTGKFIFVLLCGMLRDRKNSMLRGV